MSKRRGNTACHVCSVRPHTAIYRDKGFLLRCCSDRRCTDGYEFVKFKDEPKEGSE